MALIRPGSGPARLTLGRHLDLAPHPNLPELLLGHREGHVEGVERLQRHDRVARVEVLTEVDLPQAEDAAERRADLLAVDRGADLPHPRLRLLVLGARPVELGLGDDALADEPASPVEVQPREVPLRLGGGQLGALLPRVQADEHLALLHRLGRIRR